MVRAVHEGRPVRQGEAGRAGRLARAGEALQGPGGVQDEGHVHEDRVAAGAGHGHDQVAHLGGRPRVRHHAQRGAVGRLLILEREPAALAHPRRQAGQQDLLLGPGSGRIGGGHYRSLS